MVVGMEQDSGWNWDRDFLDRISVQYQETDQSVKFAASASAFAAAQRLPREEESAATPVASSEPKNDRRPEKWLAFRRR